MILSAARDISERLPSARAATVRRDERGDQTPIQARSESSDRGGRVVFWEHATARDLRQRAAEFIPLDPYLEHLACRSVTATVV